MLRVLKFKTDPTFVKRSITNLVNNAVQAMPDGGELGLSAQRKEDCIVICVSDTGQGIPEHVKANLFKALTTTKSKGQGLGLAVVKRLVEALNGKVSFESQEGKGTKFIIRANQQLGNTLIWRLNILSRKYPIPIVFSSGIFSVFC
jgi:signal transduction histidine kinase